MSMVNSGDLYGFTGCGFYVLIQRELLREGCNINKDKVAKQLCTQYQDFFLNKMEQSYNSQSVRH